MTFLRSKRLELRLVEDVDLWWSMNWLNDQEVTKWMQKPYPQTKESMEAYAKSMQDPHLYLAIYPSKTEYIGNISLRDNRSYNYHSEISIMIGDKAAWGYGYATEAIALLTDYCFRVRNIHKLRAGAVVDNIGCVKAFVNAGYRKETIEEQAVYANGKYRDIVIMSYLKNDWEVKE